jgi:hypothetical protein
MSDRFYKIIAGWTVAACAALLISTLAVDSSGRQITDHVEARPAGVAQLTSKAYIIYDAQAKVAPTDICNGGSDESDPSRDGVDLIQPIEQLTGAVYVVCSKGQHWNNHTAGSPNFGHALVRVVTTPLALGVGGGVLLIALLAGVGPEALRHRRERKRHLAGFEDKRSALAAAWATDKLTDQQFEAAMTRLLNGEPAGYDEGKYLPR